MWDFNKFLSDISLITKSSSKKKITPLKRQLLITYYTYSAGIIIALMANLFGYTGPQELPPIIFNIAYLTITITVILLYSIKKIKLYQAFGSLTMTTHLFTCNEMFLCALTPNPHGAMLILGNVVILVVNTMFAMFFYIKKLPFILSTLSTVTYVGCTILTNDSHLKEFAIVMIIVFAVIAVLGNLLVKNAHDLSYENWTLKQEDETLYEVLKMEKEQIHAYIGLAKQKNEHLETTKLLDILNENARNNVINNVKEALTEKEIENKNMAEIFPELTPSEIEISKLIISGKKISEISDILKKSESNITCQRTNIRKKLGLQPKDSLMEFLQSRFELFSEKKTKETSEKFRQKSFMTGSKNN